MSFACTDHYSLVILQPRHHWGWFTAKSPTLTERFRYTSDTVFDTFPWPQWATLAQVKAVAEAARSLRDLYRTLETPGTNRLRDVQSALDSAVRAAYGMKENEDPLAFLLDLNLELAAAKESGGQIRPPGLPCLLPGTNNFTSEDCIEPPVWNSLP